MLLQVIAAKGKFHVRIRHIQSSSAISSLNSCSEKSLEKRNSLGSSIIIEILRFYKLSQRYEKCLDWPLQFFLRWSEWVHTSNTRYAPASRVRKGFETIGRPITMLCGALERWCVAGRFFRFFSCCSFFLVNYVRRRASTQS